MKKLILASSVSPSIYEAEYLFDKPFGELRIAVVPTAANAETGDKQWLQNDLQVFRDKGCTLVTVELEGKTEGELRTECAGFDAVFVTGGNTYYLLYHMQQSGFDKVVTDLVHSGVVYIGSSAGSIVGCPSIETVGDADDPSVVPLSDYTALGLVDFVVVPHLNKENTTRPCAEHVLNTKSHPIIGLTDAQILVVNDGFVASGLVFLGASVILMMIKIKKGDN